MNEHQKTKVEKSQLKVYKTNKEFKGKEKIMLLINKIIGEVVKVWYKNKF